MNFLDTQPPFDIHSDPLPKLQPAKLAKHVRRVNRGLYVDPAVRAIKRRELPLVMTKQGEYTQTPDPHSTFTLWAFILTACGVIGATMLTLQVMGVL